MPAIRIVNAKLVKANAGADDGQTYLATHVAGAGPYTLKSWDRGTHMTIDRDPNYYRGWGEGPIDEVRFIITNDEGDGALPGGLWRTDDVEPIPVARHL